MALLKWLYKQYFILKEKNNLHPNLTSKIKNTSDLKTSQLPLPAKF